jgi:hypothetical protein
MAFLNEHDIAALAARESSAAGAQMTPKADLRMAALWYARNGFPVFPLHSAPGGVCSCGNPDHRPAGKEPGKAGKHPRTPHGFKDATTDQDQIETWWKQWSDANIGIPTGAVSRLLVVDVDPRNGGDESQDKLIVEHGRFPDTAEQQTGGGGRHLLFRYAGGAVPKTLAPGIDLKGDGGYIVVAPSIHWSGKAYEWDGIAGVKALLNLAEPPPWLLEYITAAHNGGRAKPTEDGEKWGKGERNNRLASLAGTMRRRGMTREAIEAALITENTKRCDPPLPETEVRSITQSVASYNPGHEKNDQGPAGESKSHPSDPWAMAEGMGKFLADGEEGADFLDPEGRLVARECITEIFSPRGLGKSLYALFLAMLLALRGLRVLLLDRDNPRHAIKARLRGFGATEALSKIKVISRENAPRLTDAAAWALFPFAEYDLVIIDSLNSSAEGIGEQDSGKPSRALAPLLDVCHREGGPAVLLLDNTIRSGSHSRGSGVIEDRADIVYEVRDATGFTPTGKKAWWEELPPADAGSWGERAGRRKGRKQFRLAFIATKFRVGEEPEPFVIEIDLTTTPWSISDVTDLVDQAGTAAREDRRREREEMIERAAAKLTDEIRRRPAETPLLVKPAEALLQQNGLSRTVARNLLKKGYGTRWRVVEIVGMQGHPKAVLPISERSVIGNIGRNAEMSEINVSEGSNRGDFGGAIFMRTAESNHNEIPMNTGVPEGPYFGGESTLLRGSESEKLASEEPEWVEGKL